MAGGLDLYLVRHGATEWSETGRHTGNSDVPLNARGAERAAALAPRLRPIDFLAVFTSDLVRARQTAELAGFSHATPEPLLREYDYGRFDGLTSAQIRLAEPGWRLYVDDCPGGESPAQVYQRATRALALLGRGEGKVLAFSHGHFIRALAVAWTGQPIAAANALALDTAALSILRDGDHGRVIQLWNEVS